MSKKPDGGAAFPHGPLEVYDEARQRWNSLDASRGMSLREWYIGKALQGFCSNPGMMHSRHEAIAELSIEQADVLMAMLYPQPEKETE